MSSIRRTWVVLATLGCPGLALAQQAAGQAGGSANIELGATQPSQVEMNANARSNATAPATHPRSDDVRLGVQGRLDVINTLAIAEPGVVATGDVALGRRLLVPMITPGVRFLDNKMFLGLGFGFRGDDVSTGPNEDSRSGFSLSPTITYDVLTDRVAALHLVGLLNFASLGESEHCTAAGCVSMNNNATGWGLSLGAGVRGFITEGLALGGELGWGFLSISQDPGTDIFLHGVFGNIFLEASVGI